MIRVRIQVQNLAKTLRRGFYFIRVLILLKNHCRKNYWILRKSQKIALCILRDNRLSMAQSYLRNSKRGKTKYSSHHNSSIGSELGCLTIPYTRERQSTAVEVNAYLAPSQNGQYSLLSFSTFQLS